MVTAEQLKTLRGYHETLAKVHKGEPAGTIAMFTVIALGELLDYRDAGEQGVRLLHEMKDRDLAATVAETGISPQAVGEKPELPLSGYSLGAQG